MSYKSIGRIGRTNGGEITQRSGSHCHHWAGSPKPIFPASTASAKCDFFLDWTLFGSKVKNLPAMHGAQEPQVRSLGVEDPLEEGMATHSSILAWRIPWTEELGGATVHKDAESDMTEATSHAHTKHIPECYGLNVEFSEVMRVGISTLIKRGNKTASLSLSPPSPPSVSLPCMSRRGHRSTQQDGLPTSREKKPQSKIYLANALTLEFQPLKLWEISFHCLNHLVCVLYLAN